ncbi:neutral zinc metallopeptidase [Luteolibacter flavescens]|uniref:Neutral zinc metallopeptidase n=1 Tax=Luteolibacter flavescens TaxID=1859460 RepID=A0ABT3FNT8_9BACT|nr:neutral zinc metallopeptidase [Luteolibacter flavescens]MCW1884999.1 neutral zinc metallopeptidase [Luteolibacter flavescens]
MRWEGRRQSENVEDRRGGRGGGGIAIGGGLGTLVLLLIVWLLGGDPMQFLQQTQGGGGGQGIEAPASPEEERAVAFVKTVLADTEEIWGAEFQRMGKTYEEPRLVLFRGTVQSGCGGASSQMGPFYCPADRTVYIDLSFFRELEDRFGAAGDFAQAYVIAHEVGHHVQSLLGISGQVQQARQRVSEKEANELSVRLELQADFLAGMWARKGQQKYDFLEEGDLEEALNAANKIGDDTLQRQAQGRVVPDSFTHGTSAQRMRWFKKGLQSDRFDPNNTFQTDDL